MWLPWWAKDTQSFIERNSIIILLLLREKRRNSSDSNISSELEANTHIRNSCSELNLPILIKQMIQGCLAPVAETGF